MTRGTTRDLVDPIDALRYKEPRGTAAIADFLQLAGYCISAGQVEKLVDAKRMKVNRIGQISDQALMRLLRKEPPFLRDLNHPTVDPDMLTIRQALAVYPELRPETIITALAAGAPHFLVSESRQRHVVVPESWVRTGLGHLNVPSKPDKGIADTKVTPKKVEPSTPPRKLEKEELVAATPSGELKVMHSDHQSLVPLIEAVEFLQGFGFNITYNDAYGFGVTNKTRVFTIVKEGGRLFVDLNYLQELVDAPPEWLAHRTGRYEAPEGFNLTRDILVSNRLNPTRFYEAIRVGLIEAEEFNAGTKQGKLFVISDVEVARALSEELLCRFLRGESVTIPEIEAARAAHRDDEHERKNGHSDLPEAEEDAEITHVAEAPDTEEPEPEVTGSEDQGPAEEPAAEGLTLPDILLMVHVAKRIGADYDHLVDEGYTDEEIVQHMSHYVVR